MHQDHIGRDEFVIVDFDEVANMYILPLAVDELLVLQPPSRSVVGFLVVFVSFLS